MAKKRGTPDTFPDLPSETNKIGDSICIFLLSLLLSPLPLPRVTANTEIYFPCL